MARQTAAQKKAAAEAKQAEGEATKAVLDRLAPAAPAKREPVSSKLHDGTVRIDN